MSGLVDYFLSVIIACFDLEQEYNDNSNTGLTGEYKYLIFNYGITNNNNNKPVGISVQCPSAFRKAKIRKCYVL